MTGKAKKRALRIADLDMQKPTAFDLQIPAGRRKTIAVELDLLDLRKLRFTGRLVPSGDADWQLTALLGATVVQPCVRTLDPVTTRIDITTTRLFLADMVMPLETEEETEIPEDENSEPLGAEIDLFAVMSEALSLALPLYPKVEGAALKTTTFTEPDKTPMSDSDARPFASLSALRDSMKKGE